MPTRMLAILSCDQPIVPAILALHFGRALRPAAGGEVIAFDTGSDAVLAAIDVQRQVRGARIGITAGEVHVKGDACSGAAVELAARVRALTPAGETYVTDAAVLTMELAPGDATILELGQLSFDRWADRLRIFRATAPREVPHTETMASACIALQGVTQIVRVGDDWQPAHERRIESYDRAVLAALRAHRGFVHEVDGEAYRVTFGRILDAVRAALAVQRSWRPGTHGGGVRVGIDHGPLTRIAARIATSEASVWIVERCEDRFDFVATDAALAAITAASPELIACLEIAPSEPMSLRGAQAPRSISQVRVADDRDDLAMRVLGPFAP